MTCDFVDKKSYDSLMDDRNQRIEENAQLKALAEKLKLEAQIQAQEACTANATIYEIYQVVSGGTGELGNWHGAEPVRETIEKLKTELEQARAKADALWACIQEEMAENVQIFDLLGVHGEIKEGRAGSDAVKDAVVQMKAELAQCQQRLERMREFITLLTTREPDHLSPLDYQRHYGNPSNP